MARSATLARVTDGRRAPHPANELNDLPGEEWLYFTKSVLTTAYPSELGHAARKAHGANKPPRLMARLIEFFSQTGELVLDPFAGVGGTLLGAAIARGPRRAIGIELDPRWVAIHHEVVAALQAEHDGAGPHIADLGTADPGGPRGFDPSGLELRLGDAQELLPALDDASVDFIATDPPYNIQLPLTMAGGALAETHANRRTDYAMISASDRDLANAPDYATFLDRMEGVLGELIRILRPGRYAVVIVRDAYQEGRYQFVGSDLANAADYPSFLDAMGRLFGELTRVLRPGRYALVIVRDAYQNGRYQFVGADLAGRAGDAGLVPKGDLIWHQAGTRLRPYGYPRVFVPNIAHQHILVLRREPAGSGSAGSRQARRRLSR